MEVEILKEFGIWGGLAALVGVAGIGFGKAYFDFRFRIEEKRADSEIKLLERKTIAEIENVNKALEARAAALENENKILRDSIAEIKEAHASAIHEFMAQIEEIQEQNAKLNQIIVEKETTIRAFEVGRSRISGGAKLHKNRFFVKMDEFLYKITTSEHKDTDIFRYVAHKITIVKLDWLNFIDNWDKFDNGQESLEGAVFQHITTQINDYKVWARRAGLDEKLIIAFDRYHEARINYIFDVNKQIIYSSLYINNYERFDALLSFWVSVFQTAVENAHNFVTRLERKKEAKQTQTIDEELDNILHEIGLQ